MAEKIEEKVVIELTREEASQLVGILGQMAGTELDELWDVLLKEMTTDERWAWQIVDVETDEPMSYEMRQAEGMTGR
jgi:hypothetical protein